MFGLRRQSDYLSNAASSSDPYASSVVLLLKGNGSNGSSTITDSSSYNRTPTSVTAVTNSTTQAKYGSGSLFLPNQTSPNPVIRYPASNDFDFTTGSWTIEFWAFWPTGHDWTNTNPNITYGLSEVANCAIGQNQMYLYAGDGGYQATISVSTNQWYHFAYVRTEGVNKPKFFKDGVEQTVTGSANWTPQGDAAQAYEIGRTPSGTTSKQNKYIDDFRITKGVARYSGNFTPPGAF